MQSKFPVIHVVCKWKGCEGAGIILRPKLKINLRYWFGFNFQLKNISVFVDLGDVQLSIIFLS